jgi:hypothetical protein
MFTLTKISYIILMKITMVIEEYKILFKFKNYSQNKLMMLGWDNVANP